MQKINFENKPSTKSPINADNLNLLQDNVEDAINEVDNKLNTSTQKHILQASLGTRGVYTDSENNSNFESTLVVGDKLSAVGNKVVIGAGVSKVKVNMNASFQSGNNGISSVSIAILKNESSVGQSYAYNSNLGMYYYSTCVISDLILEVQENDEISYKISVDKSYTLHDDEWGVSKLLVEVIE